MLGHNLRELSDREIAHWRNEHVGFIFQQFNLIPVLTALENVELPLKLTNLKKQERLEHAATALKLVGLGDRLGHLSAAAFRRAGAARGHRARHRHRPGADPGGRAYRQPGRGLGRRRADDLSQAEKEYGKTVVMVTHDPHAAASPRTSPPRKGRTGSGGEPAGRAT